MAQVIAIQNQAGGGGPGLVGMNLEDGAKIPLWPGAGRFPPLGLSFLIGK